jgi:hypothetical protein
MELNQLAKELDLSVLVDGSGETKVTGGYTSDLMSDVLAKAKPGNIWVTNQKHLNTVAVASLLGLAGVVIAGGIQPDENTIAKAQEENVALYTSDLTSFEVVGKLYGMGIRANGG